MRKRLQKKLYRGPFERFGFSIIGKFSTDADKEKVIWNFYEFLEKHQMSGAISYHPSKEDFEWYIDVGTRQMNPIEQKKIVLNWPEQGNDLSSFKTGKLHDIDDKPYHD